jgi:hypothetical protein
MQISNTKQKLHNPNDLLNANCLMLIIWLSKDTLTKEKLIIKKRKKKEQEIYDDECK